MSKVVIDDSKLVNIADAIRNKNGSANKYTPTEMATAIGDIKVSSGMELAPEDLVISGNCNQRFQNNGWNWYIEKFGDKITTKDITNCYAMFMNSNNLSSIPFDINIKDEATVDFNDMFDTCHNLTTLPQLKALNYYNCDRLTNMFYGCEHIVEIPKGYFDKLNFSSLNNATSTSMSGVFNNCYRLRKISADLSKFYSLENSAWGQLYQSTFQNCYVLDEATNLPITPDTAIISNNIFFQPFAYCGRLKRITFSLNDGIPKTAKWQKQVIDLYQYNLGYTSRLLQRRDSNS